ncbi:MAG: hydrolase [Chloroflexi bacterium]|nr:hydrolase [Chloroflexota bacterium]
MKVTLVASALLENAGKYLLVQQARSRRQPGKWGPPGGKPEQGEDLQAAALRETLEETGLLAELTGFVGVLRSGHRDDPNLFVCFAARLLPGQDAHNLKLLEGEISGGRWLDLAEIEADTVTLRSAPFKKLYRRLSEGQVYPLELVLHEILDQAG